jgi:hypothetical protein
MFISLKDLNKELHSSRNILEINNKIVALIGNIKIKFKLSEITAQTAVATAYNMDLDIMPAASTIEDAETAINNLPVNHAVKIFLENIKSDEVALAFKNAVIERILTANILFERRTGDKKSVIDDKKMEILLGKALVKQAESGRADISIAQQVITDEFIMSEAEKVFDGALDKEKRKEAAANVIEMILTYHALPIDINKYKEQLRESNKSASYKAILSAA